MAESLAVQQQPLALSSLWSIIEVSVPAVLLNAAPPITAAVQTALLGRYAGVAALGAFAAVNLCVGFVCRAFAFLVDGVSSKVGKAVGQRAWRQLAAQTRVSIGCSLGLGLVAVPVLLGARVPLCSWALALSSSVSQQAAAYWVLRSLLVPLQMLALAAAGVLQGFGRVRVNAALASGAALLEMAGSAAVLRGLASGSDDDGGGGGSLVAMGCVTCGCQALLAVAAMACIVLLPPQHAPTRMKFWRELLALGPAAGTLQQEGKLADIYGPLTSEAAEDDGQLATATAAVAPNDSHAASAVMSSLPSSMAGGALPAAEPAATAAKPAVGGSFIDSLFDAETCQFLKDGADLFVRSVVLQLTFFMALAAASRLGTTALAAHSIIGQVWQTVSYLVDGFAAAGIVLGSRLYGLARIPALRQAAQRSMARLTRRVLWAGLLSGTAAGLALQLGASPIIQVFTADQAVTAAVQAGGAWVVLAICQPLNGLLFVFDGLLLATQHFRFIRNYMCLGFIIVFCPSLALLMWQAPGLAAIWLAKGALNLWRLAGAAYLIFWRFLPAFGLDDTAASWAAERGQHADDTGAAQNHAAEQPLLSDEGLLPATA